MRQLLKKRTQAWQKQEWCIAKIDEEFVACMEDVIDAYLLPLDTAPLVVYFDESPFPLLKEIRESAL